MAYARGRYTGLGASRSAVATMCPPGERITRDGCEPVTQEADEAHVECGPGTEYYAPTDSCRPIPCPDGQIRAGDGTCVPETCPPGYERGPGGQCEPVETEEECPEGMFRDSDGRCVDSTITDPHPIDEPMDLSIQDQDEEPTEVTTTPTTSTGGGGGAAPAAWGGGAPNWWTDAPPDAADPSAAPAGDGDGFGLVEAALAAAVGIIMHRAITDRRSSA